MHIDYHDEVRACCVLGLLGFLRKRGMAFNEFSYRPIRTETDEIATMLACDLCHTSGKYLEYCCNVRIVKQNIFRKATETVYCGIACF